MYVLVFYMGEFRESNVVTVYVNVVGCFIYWYCVSGNDLWQEYLCMYFKMLF